jgi:hypothetical protein
MEIPIREPRFSLSQIVARKSLGNQRGGANVGRRTLGTDERFAATALAAEGCSAESCRAESTGPAPKRYLSQELAGKEYKEEKSRACETKVATQRGTSTPVKKETTLQQARGAETSDWISQRHRFSLKDPTSHRKPQRRVAQMNKFHILTPKKML